MTRDFKRLAPRIGRRAAIIAVAHSMLIAIYEVLQTGRPYSKDVARTSPPRNIAWFGIISDAYADSA
jgi:hypothetical protein